ncbi:hypothetical protein ACWIUD_03425 [Helicobacter sp. 23-1044]
MLHSYLQNAVSDLVALIEISILDMEDIKKAKHEAIFSRLDAKNNLIESFKINKSKADSAMREMMAKHPNKGIDELLDENAMKIIDEMRTSLKELRVLNKAYAKSVIAVSEFYNSLVGAIMPNQVGQKYGNISANHADFIRCEA